MTFELLSEGHFPFEINDDIGEDENDVKRKILEEEPQWQFFQGTKLARNFIEKCLQKDPRKRKTATELSVSDTWLQVRDFSRAHGGEEVVDKVKKRVLEFSKLNIFQKKILTIIANIASKRDNHELRELRRVFREIDRN